MDKQSVTLLEQVRQKIRLKHYSIRTEEAYTGWKDDLSFSIGQTYHSASTKRLIAWQVTKLSKIPRMAGKRFKSGSPTKAIVLV